MHSRLIFFYPLLLLLPFASAAEVYKWVDAEGNVQFSDQPPQDTSAEVVTPKIPEQDLRTLLRLQRQQDKAEQYQQQREERATQRKEAKAEKQAQLQNCEQARTNYEQASGQRRIYSTDDSGEVHYLDDAERLKYLEKLKADVEKWCK